MALKGFTRDPAKVKANLVVMDDKSVVAKKPCRIVVPARFQERDLVSLGSDTYILGIFAMILEDNTYAISMTDAMMQIDPTTTETIIMNGDQYLQFSFEKGSRVFVTIDLVKNTLMLYNIFNEFISKGNVPWYIEYEDLPHIFDTAEYHAGAKVGGNHAIYEYICAMVGRVDNNRQLHYRHYAKTHQDEITHPPVFVPFRSVIYNAPDTTAKLLGSYASDGLTSALVHPSEKTQSIESLLRR